jgi:hypothetical protein
MPLPQRAAPLPEAVTSHGLLAPPPPAPLNSPTFAFVAAPGLPGLPGPPGLPGAPGPLDDVATQSWANEPTGSTTLDPASQPGSPGITQKSWDGTVPTPALPTQKSLAPIIVGAVMTVAAAAAVAVFLLTRASSVAPTEASGGVVAPIATATATATASAAPLPTAAPVPSPAVEASVVPTASAAPAKTTIAATPRVPVTAAPPATAAPGGKKKAGQVVTDYGY